ncbi:MAG: EndoU domain-containing protein [Micromonosporaceae bacterium]
MYGDEDDETSGGHLHGLGRPDKTEFPPDWDEDKIAHKVKSVADNPDSADERFDGTWRVEAIREGVTIRAYLRGDGSISGGHPTKGPGVRRNPSRGA